MWLIFVYDLFPLLMRPIFNQLCANIITKTGQSINFVLVVISFQGCVIVDLLFFFYQLKYFLRLKDELE